MPDLSQLDIVQALREPRLIGDSISIAQEAALRALYGLPMSETQESIFVRATGRESYQPREYRESSFIVGRRGGKSSKLAANIAVYEACFRKYDLAQGEQGYVVALSPTKKQSAVVFRYVLARLSNSPTLRRMIKGEPMKDEVSLTNGVTIGVWPCNFRSVRGISIVCAICDEIAFWSDDISGSNPSPEVLRALRPAMANFPNAKLVKISSPFAKSGIVWEDWRDRDKHPETLVWKLDSATMNPKLDRDFLAQEEQRDPEFYAREYGAEFYESATSLISAEAIECCIVRDRFELLPAAEHSYTAALDAAFRGDNFAFCVVHREDEKVVQDFLCTWRGSKARPVNLSETLSQIAETLNRFGISTVFGDQFCSEPIRQSLRTMGIDFEQVKTLGTGGAPIWTSLRTLITSGRIELLDDSATLSELKKLELVVTSGGNQRVEAATGHDDRAVALALASHEAVSQPSRREPWCEALTIAVDPAEDERLWATI